MDIDVLCIDMDGLVLDITYFDLLELQRLKNRGVQPTLAHLQSENTKAHFEVMVIYKSLATFLRTRSQVLASRM